MEQGKQVCVRCVMDTSDTEITFNEEGVCSHCLNYDNNLKQYWQRDSGDEQRLSKLVDDLKSNNKSSEYDCIVGLSGGVDSSYLLLKSVSWGLKPLAVHVDAGWNSELAVKNVEGLVNRCNVDLVTHVVDWSEMQDLQLAFMKSGVANQDIPQDHCFTAAVYKTARKHRIKDLLSGSNLSTECVLPQSWGYNAMDLRQIRDIHNQYGRRKLKSYPTLNFWEYYVLYPRVLKIRSLKPLDLFNYNKDIAISELEKAGWKYYGGKHYESRFTKFFQSYYLPERFGFDKRKAHYSSLVVTGQMTRDEALLAVSVPSYDEERIGFDKDYVAKKLGITTPELELFIDQPKKTYMDYKNNEALFEFKDKIKKYLT